jgi:hypothetical protein
MNIRELLIERYPDETFLLADGFDGAIIGVDEKTWRVIYSVSKCIEILGKDMPYDDAFEYFEFNTAGAYVGEQTPIWCYDDFINLEDEG